MELAVHSTTFAGKRLRSITRADVEAWVKAMATQDRGEGKPRGLAPGTIHTRFSNVRTVLRAAVADRKIPVDPTLGVKLPKTRRAEVAMRIPSVDEVRRLLAAAAPEYQALIALCAFGGLRLGEAAALRVGDIDFLGRSIAVVRQVQRSNGGQVEIRPPKHGSERTVSAADGLLQILAQHVALRGLQGVLGAWMFPGEREGQPAHQNTVGYAWRVAKAGAKIEGALRLHDLRHFYASGLIAAGCDVATVQHALGHSSPTITLSSYTHLWPKVEDRTRAAADGLVGQVFGAADEWLTNARSGSA
jgi:integrase